MLTFLPLLVILLMLLGSSIKILNEYERGVIFRLGSYAGVRGPGLIILIPIVEKMVKVDLRVVTMDIPSQDIITKDNVTLKVNGVVYFRVNDPKNIGIMYRIKKRLFKYFSTIYYFEIFFFNLVHFLKIFVLFMVMAK